MLVILPVETAQSEDPVTMAPAEVRRVTVQLDTTEAEAVAGGDAAALAEMGTIVGAALIDAGVTP